MKETVLFERRLLKILLSRSFWGDATARERVWAGAGVGAGAAAASAALATANLIRKIWMEKSFEQEFYFPSFRLDPVIV